MFGFQETASYNFHQVPIEDFQQAKVSDFLVLSVSPIIDKDLKNFMSLILTALCLLLYLNFSSWKIILSIDIALFIFHQDHDVLLVSYADNGSGVWTYGDVVENKYVFQTCTSSSLYPITCISNLQILLVIVYSSEFN